MLKMGNVIPEYRLSEARSRRKFESCDHLQFTDEVLMVDAAGNSYLVSECKECGCASLRAAFSAVDLQN